MTARVLSQTEKAPGIFDLLLFAGEAAEEARPGQFVNLFSRDRSHLLPRPISIAGAGKGALRLVYRVSGAGTLEFSALGSGDTVELAGPFGNGFPETPGRSLYLGGGIGIPPLLFLAARRGEGTAVVGYRDHYTPLLLELASLVPTRVATEDGSIGVKGNVLDVLRKETPDCDQIFACGPLPMLRAVRDYARERDLPCFLSLEERMACGVGACLGCVVRTPGEHPATHVHNARVCKDGPVFSADEVIL